MRHKGVVLDGESAVGGCDLYEFEGQDSGGDGEFHQIET